MHQLDKLSHRRPGRRHRRRPETLVCLGAHHNMYDIKGKGDGHFCEKQSQLDPIDGLQNFTLPLHCKEKQKLNKIA